MRVRPTHAGPARLRSLVATTLLPLLLLAAPAIADSAAFARNAVQEDLLSDLAAQRKALPVGAFELEHGTPAEPVEAASLGGDASAVRAPQRIELGEIEIDSFLPALMRTSVLEESDRLVDAAGDLTLANGTDHVSLEPEPRAASLLESGERLR